MTAYAIGHLHDVAMGPDIVAYLRRIDDTLAPFGGRFIIHGGPVELLEGSWSGDVIVIAAGVRRIGRRPGHAASSVTASAHSSAIST